jgi:hypothetical protein
MAKLKPEERFRVRCTNAPGGGYVTTTAMSKERAEAHAAHLNATDDCQATDHEAIAEEVLRPFHGPLI